MSSIRKFVPDDLISIQTENLLSLPENYPMKFYYLHLLTTPELSWVAVDENERVVGYVLGKLDDDDVECGMITSVAVGRSYRRLGIAQKLMRQAEIKMIEIYNLKKCKLDVRESNYAAFHLYSNVLGFKLVDVDKKYYADGENGLIMEQDLVELAKELGLTPFKGINREKSAAETANEMERKSTSKSKCKPKRM